MKVLVTLKDRNLLAVTCLELKDKGLVFHTVYDKFNCITGEISDDKLKDISQVSNVIAVEKQRDFTIE